MIAAGKNARAMAAQRQLRLAAVAALEAASTAGDLQWDVQSPGEWPSQISQLPVLLVRCGGNGKISKGRQNPEFDTTIHLEVEGRLQGTNQADAQNRLETLIYQVENALLDDYSLGLIVQQFSTIETTTEVNVDGKQYLSGFFMKAQVEVYEAFGADLDVPAPADWPIDSSPLAAFQQIGLHADLENIFDPNGTYAGAEFPDSVTAAPRPYGPDGRDEAYMELLNLDYRGPSVLGLDFDFMLDFSTLE